MTTYAQAVIDLVGDKFIGGPTDGPITEINLVEGTTPPTEEQIQAKLAELQAEYEANQYQRDRLAEYPSIQECVHAILDDDLEALQAKRSAVKAKYPKPE